MLQFLLRRLVFAIPVLIGILFVAFALTRLIPGDACAAMLGDRYTPEKCLEFREHYGLNDPIPIQFVKYLGNVMQGELGNSIRFSRPVTDIVSERLPMTMELAFFAMVFATLVGIPLGVISAVRHNTKTDVATMVGANIGVSMPVFWLGLMLAYFFALVLKDTPFYIPPSGRVTAGLSMEPLVQAWGLQDASGVVKFLVQLLSNSVLVHSLLAGRIDILQDALWHLILPAVAVGTIPLAIIARLTRSSMLDVLGQDYIRTANAKGLKARDVLWKHAFRSALIPIVTIIGLQVGTLLSGAVLTETVFNLPGIGTQLTASIQGRDYPVVQGFVIVVATLFMSVNIIVDLSYAYLDPRIRTN